MGTAEYVYFGGIIIGFAAFIAYSLARMAYDPEYRKRVYERARKERNARRKKVRPHDPRAKDIFGNPMYPKEYERTERKVYKKWFDSI